MSRLPYALFQRFGVELEYMIVDARTLRIRPIADELLRAETGAYQGDAPRGRLEWSNELALHVIELKTGRPARTLNGLADALQEEVRYINRRLQPFGARLLPTAMHPWMDPARESRLWPHDNQEIYAAFDRIFGCRGHGWTNLQSAHLNLPFANEEEFVKLHAAIRVVLPLLPALAASSPFLEGRRAPYLDTRLETYRRNCARVPVVTGAVIPEPIRSIDDYHRRILERVRRAIRPLDPEKILEPEWTNARGAIARFCRDTIEIRVLDVQECPQADLAIIGFIVELLRALTDGRLSSTASQLAVPTAALDALLRQTSRSGRQARIANPALRRVFGIKSRSSLSTGTVLNELCAGLGRAHDGWRPVVEQILEHGSLAERLVRASGPHPTHRRLRGLCGELADCLETGTLFGNR